jgi:prepilin-type processing-associated H-X9-DG protein
LAFAGLDLPESLDSSASLGLPESLVSCESGVSSDAGWADPNYEIALDGSDYLTTGPGQELGPCVMNCTNHNEAYSFHTGGANLLFGDAAVRLVSDQIEPKVFAALTTRASKDIVSGADY